MRKSVIYLTFCIALIPLHLVAQDKDFGDLSLDSLLSVKVSTVSKYEQFTSEAPSSITVITKEDIKAYGYQNLEQLFNSVSGFYTSNDRNYSYLGLRGYSRPTDYNNRFLILINGFVLNDNFYNSVATGNDFYIVPMENIERVEIVKGPGSALYGTSALFAVINIITKSGTGIDGLSATVEAGSYERKYGSISYGKKYDNQLDISFSGHWGVIEGHDLYFKEYDQPENNNGVAEGMDRDEYYGYNLNLKYNGLKLLLGYGRRTKKIPTGSFETDLNSDAYTLDETALVGLSYTKAINAKSSFVAKSFLNYNYYDGYYPSEGEPYYDMSKGFYSGIEGRYLNDFAENHRLVVGMEYQSHFNAYYKAWDNYEIVIDQNYPYQIFSLYLHDEYHITGNLALTAGLRYDKLTELDGGLTPRAAMIYHPTTNTTIKALYGQAFRNPNVYERKTGDGYDLFPNMNLLREQVETMEVVVEQRLGSKVQGILNLFSNNITDMIDQVPMEDGGTQFQNISSVGAKGLELEFRLTTPGIKAYASYSFQESEDKNTGEELTNSPAHLLKSGFKFPLTGFLHIGMENFYESKRKTVYGTYNDPFLLSHINIIFKPFNNSSKSFLQGITLTAKVNNVFDTSYALPGGFEHMQDLIPQNGRNFALRLNINF